MIIIAVFIIWIVFISVPNFISIDRNVTILSLVERY